MIIHIFIAVNIGKCGVVVKEELIELITDQIECSAWLRWVTKLIYMWFNVIYLNWFSDDASHINAFQIINWHFFALTMLTGNKYYAILFLTLCAFALFWCCVKCVVFDVSCVALLLLKKIIQLNGSLTDFLLL